ncbi:response regulator [Skermanella pratensis]|uniref:response regulator n=1 Tax=Skermanella pratensis TaxID=2233999 RepID=UPI00130149AE|nr:response regulator [Skermanella pratensis]
MDPIPNPALTKTIVVIDDEKLVRLTLSRILTRAGYRVAEAANGEEGLGEVARCRPDLVICDILMPTKEGIETIRELQRSLPDLPIMAISGGGRLGSCDFLRHAEQFGARATLRKPFLPEEVILTVGRLLPEQARSPVSPVSAPA